MRLFAAVVIFTVLGRRFDERYEKRMRMQGRALVFGMVLYADEPRMVLHFDHFDQIGVRIDADRFQTGPNELVEVVVVELVAVAMTLDDVLAAVCRIPNASCLLSR